MLTSIIFCLTALLCTAAGLEKNDNSQRFNQFDWNLTKAVGGNERYKNIILSPISLKLVLATIYEGARGNSAQQLKDALALKDDVTTPNELSKILNTLKKEHEGYDLDIGTKIFMDEKAKPLPEFEKRILNLFNASIDKVDFKNTSATINHINAWAKSVTRGHIEKLLSEADTEDSIVLLLLNAVYFKGVWENKFLQNETYKGQFEIDPENTVEVEYMTATHSVKYVDSVDLNASIVRLPYVGGRFAMYILLPFQKHDLPNVMKAISPEKLRSILDDMEPLTTKLILPKFKVEFASSLAPVLRKLGITDIFNSAADLSGIADSGKDLFVSNVIQKVGLEINEQGSTAYVTTEVELANKFGDYITDFNASQPFIFFIEDEATRTVVFVGRISDPTDLGNPKVIAGPQYPVVTALGNIYPPEKPMSNADTQHISSYFDIELAQTLFNRGEKNTIVSPASIKTILGVILNGAGGRTKAEILRALRLPHNNGTAVKWHLRRYNKELQNPSKLVTIRSGNRVLVKKGVKVLDTYMNELQADYDVQVEFVDFSKMGPVVKEVNSWVKELTNGTISEIITDGSFPPSSSLVLVNAVYFKGDWEAKFDPKDNRIDCFFPETSNCIKTEFMSSTGFYKTGVYSFGHQSAQIIELPYSDSRYSMVFIVPTGGLKDLIRNLQFNPILRIIDALPHSEVAVTIPKFSVEYSIKLHDILSELRAGDMFSDKSDLTKMLAKNGKINDIVHKAKIIVNEKGTIAGAASIAYVETLIASSTLKFVVNRPFLYFIRDKELGFLFQGQYLYPTGDDVKDTSDKSNKQGEPIFKLDQNSNWHKTEAAQSMPYPPNKIQQKDKKSK